MQYKDEDDEGGLVYSDRPRRPRTFAFIQRVRGDNTRPRKPEVVFGEEIEDVIAHASLRISKLAEYWGISKSQVPVRAEMSIVQLVNPKPRIFGDIRDPEVKAELEKGLADEPSMVILSEHALSRAAGFSHVGEFELSDVSMGTFDSLFRINALRIANENRGVPRSGPSLMTRRRPREVRVQAHRRRARWNLREEAK